MSGELCTTRTAFQLLDTLFFLQYYSLVPRPLLHFQCYMQNIENAGVAWGRDYFIVAKFIRGETGTK